MSFSLTERFESSLMIPAVLELFENEDERLLVESGLVLSKLPLPLMTVDPLLQHVMSMQRE